MTGVLAERRSSTKSRLAEIRDKLSTASSLVQGKACVYATGSFGRGEASKFSDLDLFIISRGEAGKSEFRRLDEICVKADLIEVTKLLGLPEFSGDGRYLVSYSIGDLVKTVGTPEDDALNTFTARLLLLLESEPLIGDDVYNDAIEEIIGAYWRDYEDHKSSFMPAYLANDILRLWRTFCVNYEARSDREPEDAKAKGKLKNFKLKHSRLLTCFSAIIYLIATYAKNETVHPGNVKEMVLMSPTQRLENLVNDQALLPSVRSAIVNLLTKYSEFLAEVDRPEEELIKAFQNRSYASEKMKNASGFGDSVFLVLDALRGNNFYRMIVV